MPTALRVEIIADDCSHNLSNEHTDHERCIDPVPGFRLDSIYGRSIGDLTGLYPNVEHKGLDNWTSKCKSACIGTDCNASDTYELGYNYGEEWHKSINDQSRVRRPNKHRNNANKGKKAYIQRTKIIRLSSKKESQSRPVGGECRGGAKSYQTCLNEDWMLKKHRDDTPQHFEIVETVRVGTRVVG